MKGAPGGFTVVEVMIVLSISAVMLLSAVTVFSSKREDTYFSQAVYDLRSQLQSIANDVSSQNVPGLSNYKCTPVVVSGTLRPTLSLSPPTGEDCIYLGQAIQVAPNSTSMYSYPVFGLRLQPGTNDPPATPDEANAAPAIDSGGAIISALKSTYTLMNGLSVVTAKYNGTESDIMTMYSSLQSQNTSGNEIEISVVPVTGSGLPDTQVKNCVERTGGCPAPTVANTNSWDVCVALGSRQALVSLSSTPTGVVTKLNMNGCP